MASAALAPGNRLLDQEEVRQKIPLSVSSLRRLERLGRFPKRVKIGQSKVGWFEADIEAWFEEKQLSHDRGK